jgi:hypothetical protein
MVTKRTRKNKKSKKEKSQIKEVLDDIDVNNLNNLLILEEKDIDHMDPEEIVVYMNRSNRHRTRFRYSATQPERKSARLFDMRQKR